ncbi:FAD-binding oxidoreductase [Subtercola frigoramans]|uniref:D-lactate dehydrogenase (cytochrome) n=1 Tax=Subtercola frigoramans TaxID=120298 RepID=A0ABS2L0X2_9MICO|nr:FAD-linked oxidase C-terminal domain-containing protein [Subtercola frigoramans]MBM7470712.1 D-lactate dehydrogenase (cytochrome) [Subtercola frigoramans]
MTKTTEAEGVVSALRALLPLGAVSTEPTVLQAKSHDRSHHSSATPIAVVTCRSTEDVSAAVAVCALHRVPMVPRGAGTGLEGGANAVAGSVVLDLSPMNRIIAIHDGDFDAVVQAGVMKSELNTALEPHGLFFAAGPGVDASIGGMISTRASGMNAVRYGTIRENVLGLTVVLADGSVIRTGSRTRKSAAGYDLTHLMIGAEGTLGIVTEAIVRVVGVPEASVTLICSFETMSQATGVVYQALKREVPISRVELADTAQIVAINRYCGTTFSELPTLFFEVQGRPAGIAEDGATLRVLAEEAGAIGVRTTTGKAEADEIWRARVDALPAAGALIAGASTWSTDVCVPISRLAECIEATIVDVEASGLLAPIVGHVGDGNFHLAIVLPEGDGDVWAKAVALNDRLIVRALSMDGTSTGEHGIGVGKVHSLELEHGDSLPVMRAIKAALDPHALLSPGSVFPQTGRTTS